MTEGKPRAAFYCVSDRRYYLGAVGLVNSLRLAGHSEPVFLLDCGLTPDQRETLAQHVTLITAPREFAPQLLKTIAPRRHPADVMVLIDVDIIVTRALTPLIEDASQGRVVAFRDRQQRFFAEWGRLLDSSRVRPVPYVSSGLVFAGGPPGDELLDLMHEMRSKVDFERTFWRQNDRDYPFLYADQDVLNAIVATRLESDSAAALENRLLPNPPYRGLRLRDERTLRCEYRDGTEPYGIHQYVRKPWLEPTYNSVYSRFLTRLLTGPGIAIRPEREDVPIWLRDGRRARRERARINARDFLRWHLGDRLPAPIATRVEDLRHARERG